MWMQHSLHRILLQFFDEGFIIVSCCCCCCEAFTAASPATAVLVVIAVVTFLFFLALIFSEMSWCLHCLLSLLCVCVGVCGAMNLQGHKVQLAYGGALLKCGSLKEMRRVSNASDLESTPTTAALASNFAAWGFCYCLLLLCCCLEFYFCFLLILLQPVLW